MWMKCGKKKVQSEPIGRTDTWTEKKGKAQRKRMNLGGRRDVKGGGWKAKSLKE